VWLMQAWLFLDAFWTQDRIQAYLGAIPDDRLWILDLQSESRPQWQRTGSFHGKPFIWNTLHDFGGQQGLSGNLPQISAGFTEGLNRSASLQGVGITMEGIWTNYIVYDFTLSQAWGRTGDLETWATRFGSRRYGSAASAVAGQAWTALYEVAYKAGGSPRSGQFAMRPSLEAQASSYGEPIIQKAVGQLVPVWRLFVDLARRFGRSPQVAVRALQFDLVDVGREVLSAVFDMHMSHFREAMGHKETSRAKAVAGEMLGVLSDLDRLLSTDENFMLGRWLDWARSWGHDDAEQTWLEFNARNQITLWGPRGEIVDYATKAWAGLCGSYFKPRWQLFFGRAVDAVSAGAEFNQSAFNAQVLNTVELPWQHDNQRFPATPTGDAIKISSELLAKYSHFGFGDSLFA